MDTPPCKLLVRAVLLVCSSSLLACTVFEGSSDRESGRAQLGAAGEGAPPDDAHAEPAHDPNNAGDVTAMLDAGPSGAASADGGSEVMSATGEPEAAPCASDALGPANELSTLEVVLGEQAPDDTRAFGEAVALHGDTLAVSALRWTNEASSGSVRVYVRAGETWTQQAELLPAPDAPDAWFGETLALHGDTLAVGAPEEFFGTPVAGRVYVYARDDGQWSLQTTLSSETPSPTDAFGSALALSGDTLAVVAHAEDQSRIETFVRDEAGWQRAQTLHPAPAPEAEGTTSWIHAVALDGDILAASVVPGVDAPGQHVQVYERSAGHWSETAGLVGDREGELFGLALALQGARLVVGDPYLGSLAGISTVNIGGAYVFDRNCDASWTQRALLLPNPAAASSDFGRGVALDGSRIVVTSPGDHSHASGIDGAFGERSFDDDYTGAVYVFDGARFEQLDFVKSTSPGVLREKYFGSGIAASGGRVAAGSRGEDKAYVFR